MQNFSCTGDLLMTITTSKHTFFTLISFPLLEIRTHNSMQVDQITKKWLNQNGKRYINMRVFVNDFSLINAATNQEEYAAEMGKTDVAITKVSQGYQNSPHFVDAFCY